jgi:hypothetical protein
MRAAKRRTPGLAEERSLEALAQEAQRGRRDDQRRRKRRPAPERRDREQKDDGAREAEGDGASAQRHEHGDGERPEGDGADDDGDAARERTLDEPPIRRDDEPPIRRDGPARELETVARETAAAAGRDRSRRAYESSPEASRCQMPRPLKPTTTWNDEGLVTTVP